MANEFPKIFSDTGLPDQEAYLYARVKYLDLSTDTLEDITQADVASIAWTVKTKLDGGAVANGTFTASDVMERFQTYEQCDRVARWAESQPDMREEWTITPAGRKYRTVISYICRKEN